MDKSFIMLVVTIAVVSIVNSYPIDSENQSDLSNREFPSSSNDKIPNFTADENNESEDVEDSNDEESSNETKEESTEIETPKISDDHEIVKRSPNKHRLGKRSPIPNKHRIRHGPENKRARYNRLIRHQIQKRDRHQKHNGGLADIHNISKRNKHSISHGEGSRRNVKNLLSNPVPTLVYLDDAYPAI